MASPHPQPEEVGRDAGKGAPDRLVEDGFGGLGEGDGGRQHDEQHGDQQRDDEPDLHGILLVG
jgi:hypothetical protein